LLEGQPHLVGEFGLAEPPQRPHQAELLADMDIDGMGIAALGLATAFGPACLHGILALIALNERISRE
ncbi:MAG TPA: hypothetical protein VLL76_10390, partial [Candidatus Omnitrophota bacterium]|nr:hypothetical protein [Candidatus Omnitrophota bacterium]